MRVGVLELIVDTQATGQLRKIFAEYFKRNFTSIMPQAVAAWCRQLGHRVFYATFIGQADPRTLLPNDLDVVFISAFTQVSPLAYALAKLYRKAGVLTVLGGPHAKGFPADSLRFFDIVVDKCDKQLIEEILNGHYDPPALATSRRPLNDLPSIEERREDLEASLFVRGKASVTTVIPVLSSTGCPYTCDFCVDWNNDYAALSLDNLVADLRYVSQHWPGVAVGFHDPNFAIRFDQTMDAIEQIPREQRSRYVMESSLTTLKPNRLKRLRDTNCVYVISGVESWANYSNKAAVGSKQGQEKLDLVVEHFKVMRNSIAGLQANFMLGTDTDKGRDPVDMTIEFMHKTPFVWPAVNVPIPYGGTQMFENFHREKRILPTMPFGFYNAPYLSFHMRNYHPAEYYSELIRLFEAVASCGILLKRLFTRIHPTIQFIYFLQWIGTHLDLVEARNIRKMLVTDRQFLDFHEGRTENVPPYYFHRLRQRLGNYSDVLTEGDYRPTFNAAGGPSLALPVPEVQDIRGDRGLASSTTP